MYYNLKKLFSAITPHTTVRPFPNRPEKELSFEHNRKYTDLKYLVVISIFSILTLLPQYIIVSPDTESLMSTIFSTVEFSKHLKSGEYLFWTSKLGFGMPQPFSQYLYYHPIVILLMLFPINVSLIIFYQFHLIIGIIFTWKLCREFEVSQSSSLLSTITFIGCSSSLNYVYSDFWPAVFLLWTMLPGGLYLLHKLLISDRKKETNFYLICSALWFGVMLLNSHFGVFCTYSLSFLIFVISYYKEILNKSIKLILLVIIVFVIGMSKMYYHYTEMAYFSQDLYRTYIPYNLFSPKQLIGLIIGPLSWSSKATGLIIYPQPRVIWFGLSFLLFSLWGFFSSSIKHKYKSHLSVLFFGSLLFIYIPKELFLKIIAWPIAFRDPICIAAIIFGGIALDQIKEKHTIIYKIAFRTQFITVILFLLMFFALNLNLALVHLGIDNIPRFQNKNILAELTEKSDLVSWISSHINDENNRLYYSKRAKELFSLKKFEARINRNNLAFFGINQVPGYFKGISNNVIYPDLKLMHGLIESEHEVIINQYLLDVCGINYVLAIPNETKAQDLREISRYRFNDGEEIAIYSNDDVSERALLFDKDISKLSLPKKSNCRHDKILCRDFSILKGSVSSAGVELNKINYGLAINIQDSKKPKFLMVTELFRKEWSAFGSGLDVLEEIELEVFPVIGGFIGVKLPPNITNVRLTYKPFKRIVLESFSWIVLVVLLIVMTLNLLRDFICVTVEKLKI